MYKPVLILLALLVLGALGGCSSTPFSPATEVPSRTPRPTFTPRATATVPPTSTAVIAAATDTPSATDTPEEVNTSTSTPKPVAKATKPPQPVQPTQPPSPPKPVFSVFPDPSMSPLGGSAAFPCYQEGSFYELILYAKKVGQPGKRVFAPGLTFGVFSGGNLLSDYGGKKLLALTDDGGMSGYAWGSNCQRSSNVLDPDRYNGKLDISDAVRAGTTNIVIRFVRGANDLTAISPDVPVKFDQSGRWWLYFGVQ